ALGRLRPIHGAGATPRARGRHHHHGDRPPGRVAGERLRIPGAAMNGVILGLTLRLLVRQRRTLLLVILAALPVALALIFRLTGGTVDSNPDFAAGIMAHFIVALVLPLTALVVGTA